MSRSGVGGEDDPEGEVLQSIRELLQQISELQSERLRMASYASAAAAAAVAVMNPMPAPPPPLIQSDESDRIASSRLETRAEIVEAPIPSALSEAEELPNYETAFLLAAIPLAVADATGSIVDGNMSFLYHSEYSREELRQLTLFSLTKAEQLEDTMAAFRFLLNRDTRKGASIALDAISKSGQPLSLAITLAPCGDQIVGPNRERGGGSHPTHFLIYILEDDNTMNGGKNGKQPANSLTSPPPPLLPPYGMNNIV